MLILKIITRRKSIRGKISKSLIRTTESRYKNLKMSSNLKPANMIEDESVNMENSSIPMDDRLSIQADSVSLDVLQDIKEQNTVSFVELHSKSPWSLGQLVWAKIGGYPFWPGVVTFDPSTMTYVSQRTHRGLNKYYLLHVRYCADKGRHSWVPFGNIIPFDGLNDFERRCKEITPEFRKREPKIASAFVIKATLKLQWDKAVEEATKLMDKSIKTRIELFKPKTKESNFLNNLFDSIGLQDEYNKKRKSIVTDEHVAIKRLKLNMEEVEFERVDVKMKIETNFNLEDSPTSPSSHKDSSDEASITNELKNKSHSGKDGVFEVFYERNKEMAQQLDPEAKEVLIKAYLMDLWDSMSTQERSKYRGDYLQEDEMKSYYICPGSYGDDESLEPQSLKCSRKRRIKIESANEDLSDQDEINDKSMTRKKSTKYVNIIEDELSDQDERALTESENLDKFSRKQNLKSSRVSFDRDDILVESEFNEKYMRKKKSRSEKEEETSFLMDTTKRLRLYKLFKGMKNERVCQICEKTGKLIRCKGPCYSYFHLDCVKPGDSSPEPSEAGDVEENSAYKEDLKEIKEKTKEIACLDVDSYDEDNFKCIDCLSCVAPACFICHEREGVRIKCSVLACGKHYHVKCLKSWPQSQWQGERLTCPYHICHTCISDNPQNGHPRSTNEKFARCVRCPSTYHASESCLPAGSNILTGNQVICAKHYKSTHPPVNATWCFLCTKGGTLICCDTCPTSFHLECLGIDVPDGGFICEDCETGRLPLYGEVVWVKLGNYRWWPSVICYPQEIPTNIANRPHKTGEFCVMFLGTRDYYWVHRGRAFLYQDGDASAKIIGSKKVEESYKKAVEEAKLFHERLTFEKAIAKDRDNGSRHLKPPPYVKLKVNKPIGNVKIPEVDSMVACDCNPNNPNACSPESDCLNRILLIECSPDACPAGAKCQNQMFVQRKYPSMKPIHTEGRGWGLKALEPITKGQFIIEYVGEVIDEAEYKLRLQQKRERKNENYYFLTIDNNRMIDAEPKGNLSRFMNHSCQPNCETQKWTVNGDTRIGLFALRDIEPGEELTFNYNLACDGETRKPCLCKAPNCSGFIGLKVPKQHLSFVQQKKIEKAEKFKRQKKYKKSLNCWNCNLKIDNIDEAFQCDQKTCGKFYHPHCIAIEDGPDRIFHCPWHFCAECYKRTALRCAYCCNAFCQSHIDGNLREQLQSGNYICYNHTKEHANYEEVDMGEALMDYDGDGDGDGDDEIMIKNYVYVDSNYISHQVHESIEKSLPNCLSSQSNETSTRSTIIEVSLEES